MRPIVLALMAFTANALCVGVAHADAKGIVVRVATDGTPIVGVAIAVLTPEGGEPEEVDLNDAGTPPDVESGDGTLSGSAWLDGNAFSVRVRLGEQVHDAGRVSWAEADSKRDLNITVVGGLVTAEASVSKPPPPQPGASPESGGAAESVPGEDGKPPAPSSAEKGDDGGPARSPQGSGTGAQTDDGPMLPQLFGLLLGIVAIVAVVRWWWQPTDDGLGGPLGLAPLSEPGLLGPGTPSLSGGVSVWSAAAGDAAALVGPLLGTVARHRTVALLTPATLAAPKVFGGPIYPVADAQELASSLEVLLGRGVAKVAGFAVADGLDATTLAALSEAMPEGVPLVVVAVAPALELPGTVGCRRDGAGWVFSVGGGTVRAAVVPDGLVPVDA